MLPSEVDRQRLLRRLRLPDYAAELLDERGDAVRSSTAAR